MVWVISHWGWNRRHVLLKTRILPCITLFYHHHYTIGQHNIFIEMAQ